MAINIDFKEAVDNSDVRLVRIMLKDSMMIDPTFSEFEELTEYAKQKISNLYDEHDGETFSYDISTWDKDLMNEQMVNVIYNYSKERVDFIKKLCRHIYADRINTIEKERFVSEHKPINKKQISTGMIVGGGVVAAAGIVASQTALAVAGVAIAAIGGVMLVQSKGR